MNISILNYEIIEKDLDFRDLTLEALTSAFNKTFSDKDLEINLVFVRRDLITELNSKFRDKKEATDVLSFEAVGPDGIAEVYVCPEIVLERLKAADVCTPDMINKGLFRKELLRIAIHGILHVSGFDHEGYFTGSYDIATNSRDSATIDSSEEPMFKTQEALLEKLVKLID